jgi:hypothetical protein
LAYYPEGILKHCPSKEDAQMKLFATLTLVAFAALAAACADTPTDVPDLAVPGPAFNESGEGPPLESGIVTRQGVLYGMTNRTDNLLQVVGFTGFDLCTPGPNEYDVIILQRLSLADEQRLLDKLKGDVHVEVYGPRPVWCSEILSGEKLIASGTAFLRRTDNDRRPNGPNVNSWGWMLNGRLYGPDGQPFNYSATFRFQLHGCVDPPVNCDPRRVLVRSIRLTPVVE